MGNQASENMDVNANKNIPQNEIPEDKPEETVPDDLLLKSNKPKMSEFIPINGNNFANNGIKPERGSKTLMCWNCETILMIKEDWNVVQCPTCEKINRKPIDKNMLANNLNNLANIQYSNMNHFDVNMPFVYVVIICPYCRTDNKVRKNAEHMICYKCHNSVNIVKESNGSIALTTEKPNFNNGNNNSSNQPYSSVMQKSLRFSDLFFPDPMFYPGVYPINGYSAIYPNPAIDYQEYVYDNYMKKRAKFEIFKHKLKRDIDLKYNALDNNTENIRTDLGSVKEQLREIRKTFELNNTLDRSQNNTPRMNENFKTRLQSEKANKNDAVYKSLFSPGINKKY
jgi:hypothetical protein